VQHWHGDATLWSSSQRSPKLIFAMKKAARRRP